MDVEGETAREGRRAMGRTLNNIRGKVPTEALHLPGPLKDTAFYLQTPQVWDAFDGNKSKEKPGFLSTK
eukprot:8164315-Prorocentrum_lima.AAC.1